MSIKGIQRSRTWRVGSLRSAISTLGPLMPNVWIVFNLLATDAIELLAAAKQQESSVGDRCGA